MWLICIVAPPWKQAATEKTSLSLLSWEFPDDSHAVENARSVEVLNGAPGFWVVARGSHRNRRPRTTHCRVPWGGYPSVSQSGTNLDGVLTIWDTVTRENAASIEAYASSNSRCNAAQLGVRRQAQGTGANSINGSDGINHVDQMDLFGIACQRISTAQSRLGTHKPGLNHLLQDTMEVTPRDVCELGHAICRLSGRGMLSQTDDGS